MQGAFCLLPVNGCGALLGEKNQFLENGGCDQNSSRVESSANNVHRIMGMLLVVGQVEWDARVNRDERTPQRIFGHRRFGVRAPSTFGVLHPTACSSADGISPPASSRRTFAATRMLPTSWLSRSQYGSGSPRGQRRRVLQPHSSPLTEPPAHAAGTLPALKLPAKGFKYVFPFSRNSMVSSSFLGIPRLCTSALCLCFKHRQAMLNL